MKKSQTLNLNYVVIIFALLKVWGLWNISWWVVFSPILFFLGIFFLMFLVWLLAWIVQGFPKIKITYKYGGK